MVLKKNINQNPPRVVISYKYVYVYRILYFTHDWQFLKGTNKYPTHITITLIIE